MFPHSLSLGFGLGRRLQQTNDLANSSELFGPHLLFIIKLGSFFKSFCKYLQFFSSIQLPDIPSGVTHVLSQTTKIKTKQKNIIFDLTIFVMQIGSSSGFVSRGVVRGKFINYIPNPF